METPCRKPSPKSFEICQIQASAKYLAKFSPESSCSPKSPASSAPPLRFYTSPSLNEETGQSWAVGDPLAGNRTEIASGFCSDLRSSSLPSITGDQKF
ncbi:hypothetical protein U1Q18_018716 [Sarracenia purpurea var. burkii]